MYISRIKLDMENRKTLIAMESLSKIHGAVERSFKERQQRNLWRIDRLKIGTFLLIISEKKPDLTVISSQFGLEGDCGEIRNYDPFLNGIKNGSVWRFRVVANPTRFLKQEGSRGKVSAHVSEKYQIEWLEKVGESNGFSFDPARAFVTSSSWVGFQKGSSMDNVKFKAVTFEGILKVEDTELFKKALVNGLGREKAYGMGMLTVVKAIDNR